MTSSTICSHHRIRTVLLMCVVLLSASLHAQAQNKETRINLNIRNATLESFVKQLENATGFSFIYGEEVKLTHRITLEMKQKNISEILQRAFENEPITFEISGKHILLHKRPVPQKPVSRKFTISGYVTDGASSETLIGANILESRRSTHFGRLFNGSQYLVYVYFVRGVSNHYIDFCFLFHFSDCSLSSFVYKRKNRCLP